MNLFYRLRPVSPSPRAGRSSGYSLTHIPYLSVRNRSQRATVSNGVLRRRNCSGQHRMGEEFSMERRPGVRSQVAGPQRPFPPGSVKNHRRVGHPTNSSPDFRRPGQRTASRASGQYSRPSIFFGSTGHTSRGAPTGKKRGLLPANGKRNNAAFCAITSRKLRNLLRSLGRSVFRF